MIRHDGRSWFKLVGETVGAIRFIKARFINNAAIVISVVNRLVRAYVRHQITRFIRLNSVEHWKGRVIARVAMLFKHSVTQSSPFSYENFTCKF